MTCARAWSWTIVALLGPALVTDLAQAQTYAMGVQPVSLGETPAGLADVSSARCATCHAAIATEWATSLHASAWSEPAFQVAFRREPQDQCRSCHAPLADISAEQVGGTRAAFNEGIGCATCHVRDGAVLTSHEGPSPRAHRTRTLALLATSGFCAGCHEFNFPRPGARDDDVMGIAPEPMQQTFHEWRATVAWSEGACQDCHMPWVTPADGSRHRSHRFQGWTDPDMLQRAIDVDVSIHRDGAATVVTARLSATAAAGHAVPTGDILRALELRVWPADGRHLERRAVFTRSFGVVTESTVNGLPVTLLRQHTDTRLAAPGTAAPRVVALRFPIWVDAVRWRLDHLRMPEALARAEGFPDAFNRSLVVRGIATRHVAQHGRSASRAIVVAGRALE